ncbi:hypothetical protein K435DRAFT_796864 [Dendrothele bispora CBS 962.96]|uniref:Uncharacterized protein n=1 Tax=Dendrothele bispora (strain CBS 962.96) TaxID=1314807 RepID=A0A4S8M484_DENBC|nr:hypothetical protein K435DRAFT_796864 [Dendrothele bispora CBS 962.96]
MYNSLIVRGSTKKAEALRLCSGSSLGNVSNYGRRSPAERADLSSDGRVTANSLVKTLLVCAICYSQPFLVFFIDDITHSADFSTTEVDNRLFVVSTSLTHATLANSKKGLRRNGEEKKDKEKRKAQSKPKYTLAIQTNSGRSKESTFETYDVNLIPYFYPFTFLLVLTCWRGQEGKELHTGKIYLTRYPIVTLSPISTLLIATSYMSRFDRFPRPDHLESNHRKHVLDPRFLFLSHLLPLFMFSLTLCVPVAGSCYLNFSEKAFTLMTHEGFIGGWRENNRQEDRYLQTTSYGDKRTRKIPRRIPKARDRLSDLSMTISNEYGTRGRARRKHRRVREPRGTHRENDDSLTRETAAYICFSRVSWTVAGSLNLTQTYNFDSSYTSRQNKGCIGVGNIFDTGASPVRDTI